MLPQPYTGKHIIKVIKQHRNYLLLMNIQYLPQWQWEFLTSNNLLLCCSITSSDMFECRCPRLRNRLTLFHSFLCHFTMPLNTENRIIGYLLIPVLLFSVNHCTLGHGLFRQSLNGTRERELNQYDANSFTLQLELELTHIEIYCTRHHKFPCKVTM